MNACAPKLLLVLAGQSIVPRMKNQFLSLTPGVPAKADTTRHIHTPGCS